MDNIEGDFDCLNSNFVVSDDQMTIQHICHESSIATPIFLFRIEN